MDDERTPVLNLPLPHPDHLLSDDVLLLREAFFILDAEFGEQRAEVEAALAQTRSAVDTALAASTTVVTAALDNVSTEVTRRLRRLQLNQLLNLDL